MSFRLQDVRKEQNTRLCTIYNFGIRRDSVFDMTKERNVDDASEFDVKREWIYSLKTLD